MSLKSNIFLQKEELTKWKKDLITNLSVRDYYKKENIYLIKESYLSTFESKFLKSDIIDNDKALMEGLAKFEPINNNSYEVIKELLNVSNSKISELKNLPKIFPLNEINLKFFKKNILNKDNNNNRDIPKYFGDLSQGILLIRITRMFSLFFFEINDHLRQGAIKIKNKNSIMKVLSEFYKSGLQFFIKDKTGKRIGDEECYHSDEDFELYILRKFDININKIREDLEKIDEEKFLKQRSLSMRLPFSKFNIDKFLNEFNERSNELRNKLTTNINNLRFTIRPRKRNTIYYKNKNNQKELYLSQVSDFKPYDKTTFVKNDSTKDSLLDNQSEIMFDETPAGLIGLANIGATCYMNATLQCFSNVEFLREELLIPEFYDQLDKNRESKMRLTFALAEVLKNLWFKFEQKYYPPEHFKEVISDMNPLFRGIQANDPKDLILFMLETMHSELKTIDINIMVDNNFVPNEHSLYEVYLDFSNYYLSKNKSIIFDIFYGCTNIVTACLNCRSEIHNVQVNNIIFFPLEEIRKFKKYDSKTPVTVLDGFEYNQRYETYLSYYCNDCHNDNSTAISFTRYLYTPRVLIINLNRGKGIQFNVNINFDEYIDIRNYVFLNDSPHKYELIGVISHFGESGMGGHFIAFCKHLSDYGSKWYKFNDGFVDECTFKDVQNSGMPYVLFYSYINMA